MNSLVREKLILLGTRENLGEGDYFEPLNILTKSLNEEANLTVFGSLAVTYLLNSQLKTRSSKAAEIYNVAFFDESCILRRS